MTNEWIEWAGDSRLRTPLRGSCNNFINNNYNNNKIVGGMGLKVHSVMKSMQRQNFTKGNLELMLVADSKLAVFFLLGRTYRAK